MVVSVGFLAIAAAGVAIVSARFLIGSKGSGEPAGWRFAAGTLVGLVIAGASLGSLVADEHKRIASGFWLGVGIWIALVTTVRTCLASPHRSGSLTAQRTEIDFAPHD